MVVAADRVIRTTAFACRHKDNVCVNLRMNHRDASRCGCRFWIFDFNPGFRGPSKLQIR